MERKDLVRMAVDLYNKTPQGNYSLDEMNSYLLKAVFGKDDATVGTKEFDIFRATRDGKIDYALIEEIITQGTQRALEENNKLLSYIDWQNYAEGDTGEFEVLPSNEKFYISRIAEGTQGLRRQRLYGGQKVKITPVLHGVKIYEELRRIASGRVDFGHLIDVAIKSFVEARTLEAYKAVKAVFDDIASSSKYYASGTFDEATLVNLIDYIEMKTELKASIIGSKQAVRKITGVRGADSDTAKEQMFAMGYYGNFYTTPIYVLDNVLDDSDNPLLPNDLYIIAGEDKFLKGVEEGQTLIIPGNPLNNADLSQEWMMAQRFAVEAVVASKNGVYHLS